ncbi:MAG: hypothetical protein ABSA97_06925 [Verrucomicrobiia bacterium]|jgi:hypothetical protein
MTKAAKAKKPHSRPTPSRKTSGPAPERRRMKCACASCTCTVDMDHAVHRGNLVFCGEVCATNACTLEQCACEHDHCTV